MEIDFTSQKAADAANGEKNGTYSMMTQIIKQRLGKNTACKYTDIIAVLDALAAAETCGDLPRSLHPHPLKGSKKGCFAVDIRIMGKGGRGKARMIFRPNHETADTEYRIDKYQSIKRIVIEELCIDYHE